MSSALDHLRPAELHDDVALLARFAQLCRERRFTWCARDVLLVFTAAEQARTARSAAALFRWIVEGGRWERLTDEAEDRARHRFARARESQCARIRARLAAAPSVGAVNLDGVQRDPDALAHVVAALFERALASSR